LVTGQGGLLDVATPPDYTAGGYLYFTHSKARNGQGVTVLARARLEGTNLSDWQELLVTESGSDSGRHFGSRIAFDDSGHVYFSIGDRGERPHGQDLTTHAGSILRLNRDGSVPEDNPFVNGPGLPEIWSYGHRNPQGLFFDRQRGVLWSNEHGPRGGDEINIIKKGGNYGWPIVSHGKEYWGPKRVGVATSMAGMEDGIKIYTPSIAPGSLLVYSGAVFAQWQNNLFSGALKLEHLNRVVVDANFRPVKEERLLAALAERIRAVIQDQQGFIYLATDSGRIFRLQPAH
jgi:glucose/arabinose dehydrogenase